LPEEVLRKRGGKGAETLHREKDENGKSVLAVKSGRKGGKKGAEATNKEKDENGRSVNAVKGAKASNGQVWVSLHDGFVGPAGVVANHNRVLGTESEARVQLSKEEVERYTPLYEVFNYTTYLMCGKARKRTARRVPEAVLTKLRDESPTRGA
jgi:hypothetical protein